MKVQRSMPFPISLLWWMMPNFIGQVSGHPRTSFLNIPHKIPLPIIPVALPYSTFIVNMWIVEAPDPYSLVPFFLSCTVIILSLTLYPPVLIWLLNLWIGVLASKLRILSSDSSFLLEPWPLLTHSEFPSSLLSSAMHASFFSCL